MLRTSLATIVALLLAAALAPAAGAQEPRTSLPDIEDEVMCTTCNVALNVAENSPQAKRQREFIRDLIARGATKEEVKAALVEEYGENVLAVPPSEGFGRAAYLVPIGLLALGGAVVALTLPRWRRRARERAAADWSGGAGPQRAGELNAADARRLDEDLARYS